MRQRTDDLSEALERQTATSEVLRVISSSPGEPKPVFSAMLESATRICEATFGSMLLRDGDEYRRTELHNAPKKFLDFNNNAPILKARHRVVVRRKTPGEFANSTIDLLQTFADQSVVAIQNARLFESVEARTGELAKSLEDLRTAQDRLVQTEKLASLGQLTAGIAHEIKNPLNFVNNFSAALHEHRQFRRWSLLRLASACRLRASRKTSTCRMVLAIVVSKSRKSMGLVRKSNAPRFIAGEYWPCRHSVAIGLQHC